MKAEFDHEIGAFWTFTNYWMEIKKISVYNIIIINRRRVNETTVNP